VLALASPSPAHELDAGRATLAKLGLKVVMDVGSEDFRPSYLAGSDDYRASRFNEFVRDPEIKAIFCARGGYGSLRILPKISYEQLRLNPKALVGFSDITALHSAVLNLWSCIFSKRSASDQVKLRERFWAAT
jgi:muramoyltetrapeptide carboxypeptidase